MQANATIEHGVAYECRGHVWVFLFDDKNDVSLIETIGRAASDAEDDLEWVDAFRVKDLILNEVGE